MREKVQCLCLILAAVNVLIVIKASVGIWENKGFSFLYMKTIFLLTSIFLYSCSGEFILSCTGIVIFLY